MDWKRYSLVRTSILLVGRTLPCPAAWRIWNLVNVSYKISKMRVCLRTFRAWVLLLWAMPLSRVSGVPIYPAIFKDYKLEAFWSVLSARPKSWLYCIYKLTKVSAELTGESLQSQRDLQVLPWTWGCTVTVLFFSAKITVWSLDINWIPDIRKFKLQAVQAALFFDTWFESWMPAFGWFPFLPLCLSMLHLQGSKAFC